MIHARPVSFFARHESNIKLNSISEFCDDNIGENTGNSGLLGRGMYVTNQIYAKNDPGYGKIKNHFHVKLSKPFIISTQSVKELMNGFLLSDGFLSELNFALNSYPEISFMKLNVNADLTAILQIEKFDGVIFMKNGIVVECCIFDNAEIRQK